MKQLKVWLETLSLLCILKLVRVNSAHDKPYSERSDRPYNPRPSYIQRPDYLPEQREELTDTQMNVRNSGLLDDGRQGDTSNQEHLRDNELSFTDRSKSPPSRRFSSYPRHSYSRRRRPRHRYSRRNRRPNNSRSTPKRRSRPNYQRSKSNFQKESPNNHRETFDIIQQALELSKLETYKVFYNKTLSSCGNGTNYLCKFDPENKTMEYMRCIPAQERCDGTSQCPLGDDEEGCTTCNASQVRCREGTCATVCNGIPECKLLEDEIFCAPVCRDDHLRCPDGNCAIVCDGKKDCKNNEDERNCK